MPSPQDFIMSSLRKQCLDGGCSERDANECAAEGLRKFKRGAKAKEILDNFHKPYVKKAKKAKKAKKLKV